MNFEKPVLKPNEEERSRSTTYKVSNEQQNTSPLVEGNISSTNKFPRHPEIMPIHDNNELKETIHEENTTCGDMNDSSNIENIVRTPTLQVDDVSESNQQQNHFNFNNVVESGIAACKTDVIASNIEINNDINILTDKDDKNDNAKTGDSAERSSSNDAALVVNTMRKRRKAQPLITDENLNRRSNRDHNRMSFPNKNSLQYKRLNDFFFQESRRRISAHGSQITTLNNLTIKKVCGSPNIYTIANFLNKSELQHLEEKITKGSFQRSFVDQSASNGKEGKTNTKNNDTVFDDRHRSSTFLSFQKQEDKKIQAIEQRAADLLGYWSSTSAVEPLQLVRYLPGQHFGVHHDLGEYDSYTGNVTLPPKSFLCHRRLVTIFVYLNKCINGGETHFPAAGNLRISPTEPGSAILFCNILEDGKPDPRTVHEGTKVGAGSIKYGLNIWLGEA